MAAPLFRRAPQGPDDRAERPAHLQVRLLALVFAGGTLGTAMRAGLGLLLPPPATGLFASVPVTTVGINIVGAFALGLLVEALSRRGDDTGWRRTVRLTLGTGLLGGFTTYSALAVDTGTLAIHGAPAAASLYALGTVVIGLAASFAGIALARALVHRGVVGRGTP